MVGPNMLEAVRCGSCGLEPMTPHCDGEDMPDGVLYTLAADLMAEAVWYLPIEYWPPIMDPAEGQVPCSRHTTKVNPCRLCLSYF
jgi:hypothetical protein